MQGWNIPVSYRLKVQMLQFHSAVLAVMQVKLKFFTLANVNC